MNYQVIEERLIGHGCSTFSKRKDQYVYNHPSHIVQSDGCMLLGNDGVWYLDTVCGLGSNILDISNNFSKPSILEPMVAQLLLKRLRLFKNCQVKFLKTGSAACEAAIRYARAWSGKKVTYGTGYHGCSNVFISAEEPGSGTHDESYFKFNNLMELVAALRIGDNDVGVVIVEPVQLDISNTIKSLLVELREICTKKKIVLIFDEIITGWRVPYFCISQWWNILPDLICVGKAIGNGYPIAMVVGHKDILSYNGVFISNTHNGEHASLKSAYETLKELDKTKLRRFWNRGNRFRKIVNKILLKEGGGKLELVGYNTRGEWRGDEEFKTVLFELMASRKILLGKAWFLNVNHTVRHLHSILVNIEACCKLIIKKGVSKSGYIPQPIFKRN